MSSMLSGHTISCPNSLSHFTPVIELPTLCSKPETLMVPVVQLPCKSFSNDSAPDACRVISQTGVPLGNRDSSQRETAEDINGKSLLHARISVWRCHSGLVDSSGNWASMVMFAHFMSDYTHVKTLDELCIQDMIVTSQPSWLFHIWSPNSQISGCAHTLV